MTREAPTPYPKGPVGPIFILIPPRGYLWGIDTVGAGAVVVRAERP